MDSFQSDRLSITTATAQMLDEATRTMNVGDLLKCNSAFRKLSAVQKRHLESLAEGPISFEPGERLWRAGTPVDRAFIIVSGTASFAPKRRNAGSADKTSMRVDAMKAIKELGVKHSHAPPNSDDNSMSSVESPG